jgi:hypothetical protein
MAELQKFEIAAGGAAQIGPLLTKIGGIFEGGNKKAIEKLLKNFATLKVQTKFPKTAFKNFGDFISGGLTPFVTAVNAMPAATAAKLTTIQVDFDKFKQTLKAVGNAKTLKDAVKITNALGKDGKVTVKGFPDKIELKIEVIMSADKVAKAMIKTKKFVAKS